MKKYALVIGLAGFLVGCSTYQKAVKSEDTEHQLTVANQLYEEGDFRRAANLYELIEKNEVLHKSYFCSWLQKLGNTLFDAIWY